MHGICENDKMVSVKEKPWHNLGIVLEDYVDKESIINISGLNYNVHKESLQTSSGLVIPNKVGLITDDNLCVGLCSEGYQVIQNSELFDYAELFTKQNNQEVKWETCGSLFNKKKVFIVIKLEDSSVLGDKVNNYFFITNSFDGSSSLIAGVSPIRVVCNNTLNIAINSASRSWSIRHSGDVDGKIKSVVSSIENTNVYLKEFAKNAEHMASQKIKFDTFLENFVRTMQQREVYTEKHIQEVALGIRNIYENTQDLNNFKDTSWGVYNSVADFVSNTKPLRNTKTYNEKVLNNFFVNKSPIMNITQELLAA